MNPIKRFNYYRKKITEIPDNVEPLTHLMIRTTGECVYYASHHKTIKTKSINQWVKGLTKINVPCGPINNIKQVFDDEQVKSRRMIIPMNHPKSKNKKIKIIGSPMKFSISKVKYKKSPPTLGADTQKILKYFCC